MNGFVCLLVASSLAQMAPPPMPQPPQRLAGAREVAIVESAAAVVSELAAIPIREIPPALIHDAQGVAVFPGVIKAGFLVGGQYGRGVLLVRTADGGWSNPIFLTITGGSLGWQIGIQATDLVLVFKGRNSVNRILEGKSKVKLGGDIAIAAGPIGRRAEAGTDLKLTAEVYSYSRSRGLFAGVSLEGAALLIDAPANEAFYWEKDITPAAIIQRPPTEVPQVAEVLKANLRQLSGPAPVMVAPPAAPTPPPGQPQLAPPILYPTTPEPPLAPMPRPVPGQQPLPPPPPPRN
ncbi:MAG: lipid-binding SYLF domain-containing protein [Gemmataceae bacterium]